MLTVAACRASTLDVWVSIVSTSVASIAVASQACRVSTLGVCATRNSGDREMPEYVYICACWEMPACSNLAEWLVMGPKARAKGAEGRPRRAPSAPQTATAGAFGAGEASDETTGWGQPTAHSARCLAVVAAARAAGAATPAGWGAAVPPGSAAAVAAAAGGGWARAAAWVRRARVERRTSERSGHRKRGCPLLCTARTRLPG